MINEESGMTRDEFAGEIESPTDAPTDAAVLISTAPAWYVGAFGVPRDAELPE